MHEVDDIHGVCVNASEPLHHCFELTGDIVEIETLAAHRRAGRSYLLACDFVPPAIDGVEEALREVGAGAEQLHLRARFRWRDTTHKGAIIAPGQAQYLIVFKMEDARFECDFGCKPPEG